MPMKVILLQDIPGLGTPGEIKSVADGYARNYLLPRQMVTPATPAALSTLQERLANEKRRQERLQADLAALAEQLQQITLTFVVRVGGQNRLYGSITSQNIASALREQNNIIIDRRSITLTDPLRALGSYKVPIHLAHGLDPEITIELTSSESES
jgi:large subunit ribosomal protein L9